MAGVVFLILVVDMQVLLVFILYVRSTAINPADPGIMSKFNSDDVANKLNVKHGMSLKDLPRKFDETGSAMHSSFSSPSRSSIAPANSSKKGSVGQIERAETAGQPPSRKSSHNIGLIFCALFVHEDCRKQEGIAEQQSNGEDALFCTLCNAEVLCCKKCAGSLILFVVLIYPFWLWVWLSLWIQ